MNSTPILLELFCGLSGWSKGFHLEGWHTIGVDWLDFSASAPGQFIQADLRTWQPPAQLRVTLIIASPPCQEYSRMSMPWTRARNPPPPSTELWNAALRIANSILARCIIENVRGAQAYHRRSVLNYGAFHLWGDVPALIPSGRNAPKERLSSTQAQERAIVPIELSRWLARVCK